MGVVEIVLIVLGIAAYAIGFLLPSGKERETDNTTRIDEEAIRDVVDREVDKAKSQIDDIVEETITYAMERSERAMDRLTNEKMLAVNEYSDTVLTEINKNHKEVVFLYDMLNDKHDSLKATVSEAVKAEGEIKQTAKDAEITAREVQERVVRIQEKVDIIEGESSAAPVAAADKAPAQNQTDDFQPISAERVKVIYPPGEEKIQETDALKESPVKPVRSGKARRESIKKETSGEVAAAEVAVPSGSVEADGERTNKERILELHNAGKSNMAIARELGMGLGEVKLVIDLFEGA